MTKYMFVLVVSFSLPFIFSFWPGLKFYHNISALIKSIILVMIIFGAWDVFATYRKHWYFDVNSLYPIRIVNLPLEEFLFFVVIPFCCIFTWEAIKYIKKSIK